MKKTQSTLSKKYLVTSIIVTSVLTLGIYTFPYLGDSLRATILVQNTEDESLQKQADLQDRERWYKDLSRPVKDIDREIRSLDRKARRKGINLSDIKAGNQDLQNSFSKARQYIDAGDPDEANIYLEEVNDLQQDLWNRVNGIRNTVEFVSQIKNEERDLKNLKREIKRISRELKRDGRLEVVNQSVQQAESILKSAQAAYDAKNADDAMDGLENYRSARDDIWPIINDLNEEGDQIREQEEQQRRNKDAARWYKDLNRETKSIGKDIRRMKRMSSRTKGVIDIKPFNKDYGAILDLLKEARKALGAGDNDLADEYLQEANELGQDLRGQIDEVRSIFEFSRRIKEEKRENRKQQREYKRLKRKTKRTPTEGLEAIKPQIDEAIKYIRQAEEYFKRGEVYDAVDMLEEAGMIREDIWPQFDDIREIVDAARNIKRTLRDIKRELRGIKHIRKKLEKAGGDLAEFDALIDDAKNLYNELKTAYKAKDYNTGIDIMQDLEDLRYNFEDIIKIIEY